ncbi:MAG: AMP-binding protein, partial [Gammaproteobacteria bacterium]|nr:AMP-binding protein [Gammaproteobacteria bacterium]
TTPTYIHPLSDGGEKTPDGLGRQGVDGDQAPFPQPGELPRRWANALGELGIGAGDMVATLMENCLDSQHVWLGAALLRAVEVPLSPLLRGDSLVHALNDSRCVVLVAAAEFCPNVMAVAERLEHLERIVVVKPGEALPDSAFETVSRGSLLESVGTALSVDLPAPGDIACVLYTSGTTGPSKGTLIPWGQVNANAAATDFSAFTNNDVCYYTGAANHAGARSQPLTMAALGGRFVMRPSFRTQDFWSDVDTYECTFTILVGAMAHYLMSFPASPEDSAHALKYVLMAPVLPNVEEFRRRFGVEVCTGYSMTELSGPITSDGWRIEVPASCGKLRVGWPYYDARLVDGDGRDVPLGREGELLVRTKAPHTLNAGYLNRPEATAEAWRDGWFHTGDVFRQDENENFYFIDRRKDAIRKSGENVSSFEVEMQLSAHEHIAECAAIAVPADSVEDEIKVFLVPVQGSEIDPEDVVRFAARCMPRFMVPRYLEVVGELPKTPTLRVQKAELRKRPRTNEWDRVAAGVDIRKLQG